MGAAVLPNNLPLLSVPSGRRAHCNPGGATPWIIEETLLVEGVLGQPWSSPLGSPFKNELGTQLWVVQFPDSLLMQHHRDQAQATLFPGAHCKTPRTRVFAPNLFPLGWPRLICSSVWGSPCPLLLLPSFPFTGVRSASHSEILSCPSLLPPPLSWLLNSWLCPLMLSRGPKLTPRALWPLRTPGYELTEPSLERQCPHWIPSVGDTQKEAPELPAGRYQAEDWFRQHYLSCSSWKLCLWGIKKITGMEKVSQKVVSIFFFSTLIYHTEMTDAWQARNAC